MDVHLEKKTAPHFDEAVLPSALPGGFGTVEVSVSFPSVPAVVYGGAGLLVGVAPGAGPGANSFMGWEVSLSPGSGELGSVVLVFHDQNSNQLAKSSVAVPLHTFLALSVTIAKPAAGQSGLVFTVSVAGKVVLKHTSSDNIKPNTAVGVRAYEVDAAFSAFSVKPAVQERNPSQRYLADRFGGPQPAVGTLEPVLMRYSAGIEHDAAVSGDYLSVDFGVIGVTEMTKYSLPESGTNLGEARAFRECVEQFLLDSKMRENNALRYNAGEQSTVFLFCFHCRPSSLKTMPFVAAVCP